MYKTQMQRKLSAKALREAERDRQREEAYQQQRKDHEQRLKNFVLAPEEASAFDQYASAYAQARFTNVPPMPTVAGLPLSAFSPLEQCWQSVPDEAIWFAKTMILARRVLMAKKKR